MNGFTHEDLLVHRGRRSGIEIVIAIHSTVLGPALGGCRIWRYESIDAAVDDALRLSSAMTLKAAAAGLALGGGKSVIALPSDGDAPRGAAREALLRDFADALNGLGGSYITAEDVGSTSADMAMLARFTDHVVGRPPETGGSGDPGAFTALGVEAAMRACCREAFGSADLAGRSVAIVGVGSVGTALARRLAAAGATLVLADVDSKKQALAAELGARWAEPDAALRSHVDVVAPCALGGVIDAALIDQLSCRVVCGSANNQLVDDACADALAQREVLYAPDFIVNAGGLINVALELTGYDPKLARQRIAEIEPLMGRVLEHARSERLTPLASAIALAQARLAAAPAAAAPGADIAGTTRPRRRRALARSSD